MKIIGIIILLFQSILSISAQKNNQFVNVFIGTDGTGHTFPGPSMPFGMVQPGLDNRDDGWNHTSGYQYQDSIVLGFSQTRFSGTGISEMGDILLLPFVETKETHLKTVFSKTQKKLKSAITVSLKKMISKLN